MSLSVRPIARVRGEDSQGNEAAAWRTRRATTLSMLMFTGVLAVTSYRAITLQNVPGHPDARSWVLQDFRDSVYFPAVAFLQGGNPYDADAYMRAYPVWRPLPLYSPLILVVHLPFGLLPYEASECAYYLFVLALTLGLARMSLQLCGLPATAGPVFGLAAVILLTRPGQMNLLLGQVTLQCVIGVYLALHFARTRPWLAGLGLALSTFKPTFGIPLGVLLLCRRDTRAVLIGAGIAGLLTGAATAALAHAAGGFGALGRSVIASHAAFTGQAFNDPVSAPFRIDTPALIERLSGVDMGLLGELIVGLVVLTLAALTVRRIASREQNAASRWLSATIICIAVLTCTYHQAYDLLLLALPLTALIANRWVPQARDQPTPRAFLILLFVLPAANYLASATAIDALGVRGFWWVAATSLNGAALLAALLICVVLGSRHQGVVWDT